jgi:diguanylate cyclase (GGDEF)-like protein
VPWSRSFAANRDERRWVVPAAVYDAASCDRLPSARSRTARSKSTDRNRSIQESDVADDETRRPDPLTALATGAEALARGEDLDESLEALVGAAAAAVGADSAAISLQDPDRPDAELTFTVGLDDAGQAALAAAVAAADHPLTVAARDRAEASGSDSIAYPLVVGRGGIEQALGAVLFRWSAGIPALSDDDAAFLRAAADLVAVAVDRSRLASTIAERSEWFERLAHTDPLTGLANQRTFARVLELELARAGRQGSEVSVAIFDVDDFAATNEAGGRDAGDDVLRSVASVLAGAVRLVDTVARMGGDEFVLVAPGSAGLTVARRVLDGVAELPEIGGRRVSVSAGVARFPVDGTDADAIIAAAQAALERGRSEGRGSLETAAG